MLSVRARLVKRRRNFANNSKSEILEVILAPTINFRTTLGQKPRLVREKSITGDQTMSKNSKFGIAGIKQYWRIASERDERDPTAAGSLCIVSLV
jgi:hypothetical protein